MAAKKTVIASAVLEVCKVGLEAQANVTHASAQLGMAKVAVIVMLRNAIKERKLVALDYEAVRIEIAPAFPAVAGSKVHLVQLSKYAKAIVALSHGYTASDADNNFTTYVNKAQAHGVAEGWWKAGSGGKKTHVAKSKAVTVVGVDSAIAIVTAGCDVTLAEAIRTACAQGDRTWLVQAWTAEKARRAAEATKGASALIGGLSKEQISELKKLLAA